MKEIILILAHIWAYNRMINLNRYFCHYYKWDSVEGFHKKAFQFKAMGKDKNATMDNEFSAGLQFYF